MTSADATHVAHHFDDAQQQYDAASLGMWLFIHLMQLVNFRNRVLVFVQWAWNYVTYDRSALLITGEDREERQDRGD